MTHLILWRHAEAEVRSESGADADRALTKKGHKDAAKIAAWLNAHLPQNTEILCSPARRCLETASALQQRKPTKIKREIKVVAFLGVDNTVNAIAKQISHEERNQTLLMIGHQPNLGLLISRLLGTQERACVVKKGAVWWLHQRDLPDNARQATHYDLLTVQHPDD